MSGINAEAIFFFFSLYLASKMFATANDFIVSHFSLFGLCFNFTTLSVCSSFSNLAPNVANPFYVSCACNCQDTGKVCVLSSLFCFYYHLFYLTIKVSTFSPTKLDGIVTRLEVFISFPNMGHDFLEPKFMRILFIVAVALIGYLGGV